MRPSFEKNLREFSALAKDQMSAEDSEALEKLETVIDYHLERAAKTQETTTEGQEKVFEIQKEKQRIMERLHENLRCLDDENCTPERPEGSRLVTFDEKENKFLVEMPDGSQEPATLGDILTDGDWGLVYYLDPRIVPRMAQKKFFVESAKRELRVLLDGQLMVDESAGFKTSIRNIVRARRVIKSGIFDFGVLKEGVIRDIRGHIAEIAVKTFFQQLYINRLTPFRVVEADAYQDVAEKIDFIIHIEKYKRGVGVEASSKYSNVAVQFTLQKHAHGKNTQISRVRQDLIDSGTVDSIVLIKFPMENLIEFYQHWIGNGMPPGGPFQYSPLNLRQNLFQRVLIRALKSRDTEEIWQEIEPQLKFRERE